MRLRAPTFVVFLSRTVILPVMLWRKRFPREAPAPSEVRPDLSRAHALTQVDLLEMLAAAADRAVTALRQPHASRVTHAYFGALSPYRALRLLTAHTRHHTGGLRERLSAD